MILEALAAEVRLAQLAALHHGAHRAIEHENAFGEQGLQRVECGHKCVRWLAAGEPSRRSSRCFLRAEADFVPIASSTANGIVGAPRAERDLEVAEAGLGQQALELVVAEPEPAIAQLLADPGLVVRPEIEDQQPSARLENPRRLTSAPARDQPRDAALARAARHPSCCSRSGAFRARLSSR